MSLQIETGTIIMAVIGMRASTITQYFSMSSTSSAYSRKSFLI